MAIQDKISIETRFQLDNTPENFKITDNTDYASEGIATSDVEGILTITDPLGSVIHTGTFTSPDIDLDAQTYIDTILLPEDSNFDILKGSYSILYTSRVSGAIQPGDYSQTFSYDYCYDPVDVDVLITVDLICSKLTSVDNTNYPTEVTSNTRVHTIYPPSTLDDTEYPDAVAATASLIYTPITTKTWTGEVVSLLELTYADGLIVDVTVTGSKEKNIKSGMNICNIKCNMQSLVRKYDSALATNPINATRIYNNELAPAITSMMMFNASISCGNFEEAEGYYNDILKYTGSTPDCQCSDSDDPTLITAICSSDGVLQIQDETVNLPKQANLNFEGNAVVASDNPSTGATDVTITDTHILIEDEGTPLAVQPSLNFVGTAVAVSDNPGNNTTDVTINLGGGSAHIIQDEGTPLAVQPNLNFIGDVVTATDNPGNNSTDITIAGITEDVWTIVNGIPMFANTLPTPWAGIVTNAVNLSLRYRTVGKTVYISFSTDVNDVQVTSSGNISFHLQITLPVGIVPSGLDPLGESFLGTALLRQRNFIHPSIPVTSTIVSNGSGGHTLRFVGVTLLGAYSGARFALEGQMFFPIN